MYNLDPPENALVLSVDEKSQIQALDRTQPELLMRSGEARRLTATYKRHGTTCLLTALFVHGGEVMARCRDKNDLELPRFGGQSAASVMKRGAGTSFHS